MTPFVTHSIEVKRPAADVFAFLEQFDRHAEWQPSLISANVETEGPIRVGTRVVERRKTPVGTRDVPFEVTEHEPPRRLAFQGTSGPVRPVAKATVDALGASRSRITFEIALQGRGIGRLIAPLVRRQVNQEVPHRLQGYKTALEGAGLSE